MTRRLLLLLCVLVLSGFAPLAQDKPPTLTEVQRLTVLTTVQRFEIAQLRAKAAQRDLEILIDSLQVKGYSLDLGTLAYTPLPAKPEP